MLTDEQLGRALRELPRESASLGFTERVVGRLAAGSSRPARPGWISPRWAAVALTLTLAVAGGWWQIESDRRLARHAELEELRRESGRLSAELQALRRQAEQEAPVFYLGGTEDVDYVIDFARFDTTRDGATQGL